MDIVILGGGPGGYTSAIRAAQLGANVRIIEMEDIGGTCLNKGCIPTKVLLHTTEIYSSLKEEGEELGLSLGQVDINWGKIQERKGLAVSQLVEGVKQILESHKIETINGVGRFVSKDKIEVEKEDGHKEIINFDKVIIATGSKPIIIPIPGKDLEGVITSREALDLEEIPESITIIGGGVIGVEFANIFSNLGCKVTIVEMLPDLLANMDKDIVEHLENTLEGRGVGIYKNARVEGIEKVGEKLQLKLDGLEETIVSEKVLMATGRLSNTQGLGLEELGMKMDKGSIVVDKLFKTNIDNIYAIGDCTNGIQLAHVASSAGAQVAETIMGQVKPVDFKTTPYCVYTKPELASVGLTEDEAIEKGYQVKIGKFPLYGNAKSIILGNVTGMVKFVIDNKNGEILGLHIAGNSATELIAIGALAIRLEATVGEILTTIYAHPTVGESIHEAAEDVVGRAIHIPG